MNPTAQAPTTPTLAAQERTAKPRRGTKATPTELLKLAKQNLGMQTKTAARSLLMEAGYIANAAAIQDFFDTINRILSSRANRIDNRIRDKLGYLPAVSPARTTTSAVKLPKGTPAQRLQTLRIDSVIALAKSMLRHGAPGGTTFTVSFASQASEVTYEIELGTNRNVYGGAFKGWAANVDQHSIRVPADWRLRVQRKGLANLGGLMTLDAHPMLSEGDIELYAATWVQQERGYRVSVVRGYIAKLDDQHFHAESRQSALEGIRKKLQRALSLGQSADGSSSYTASVESFIQRHRGLKLQVSLADARATGACEFGIRSWCAAVGLPYEAGQASLAQVLEGFRIRPQQEVRSVVLQTVRRHRGAAPTDDSTEGAGA